MSSIVLTPSRNIIAGNAGVGVGEERQKDQIVQVYTLHQDPEVIGQDEVLPEADEHLAMPVVLLFGQPVMITTCDDDIRQSDAGHEEYILQ